MSFRKLTTTEINQMNNANLKSTLKDMLKKFEELEKDQTAADETATSAGNSDNETNKLLGEILSEVKKFNDPCLRKPGGGVQMVRPGF